MRFAPILAGLLLASTAALAQPAPQGGPGYDQPPPYQGQPYQGQPYQGQPYQGQPSQGQQEQMPQDQSQQGQMQPGAQDPNMAPPMQQGQRPHGMRLRQRFEAANVTHDGRLTMEQAQAANMGAIAHHFTDIDADHKGYVTLQDIRAWHRATHQARQQQQAPQQ